MIYFILGCLAMAPALWIQRGHIRDAEESAEFWYASSERWLDAYCERKANR